MVHPLVFHCRYLVLVLALPMASGCGGPAHTYDATVTGTVTIEGELAKSGTVTFQPVAKEGKIAVGRIYPDGSFSMRTGQGDLRESDGGTVVPGDYIVTVSINAPPRADVVVGEGGPPVAGPSLIDPKYGQRETSDLRCTVKAGENVLTFELKRADGDGASEQPPTDPPGESVNPADGDPAAVRGAST